MIPMFFASGKSSLMHLACSSSGARSVVPEIFFPVVPDQSDISSAVVIDVPRIGIESVAAEAA